MCYNTEKGGDKMRVGEKIKLRRTERGWSLQDLADRMGYANKSTIARVESGAIDPPQSKVVKFAEVLGTSVADLMGWIEEIDNNPEEMAQLHFEILMDEDINDMFDDFKTLDKQERQLVKDLVRSLSKSKKEV